jgi:hypothetical protein
VADQVADVDDKSKLWIPAKTPEGRRCVQLRFDVPMQDLVIDGDPLEVAQRVQDFLASDKLELRDPTFQQPIVLTRYGAGHVIATITGWVPEGQMSDEEVRAKNMVRDRIVYPEHRPKRRPN